MRLYLKNIGMLKEADVKLDGLTVIAGENDTAKSTVGKILFAILKAKLFALNSKTQYKNKFNWLIKNIFENRSNFTLVSIFCLALMAFSRSVLLL